MGKEKRRRIGAFSFNSLLYGGARGISPDSPDVCQRRILLTHSFIFWNFLRKNQKMHIPRKQHNRSKGTACCSASNGIKPVNSYCA